MRLAAFLLVVSTVLACGKSASGELAADRIPPGTGWQCWTGRCDRICRGMPGAETADGRHPEPVCERPKTAFCTTYRLSKEPHWECFPDRTSCEANQRHYLSEATAGDHYADVSPCTELP